jgi:hypothetical protein
MMQIYIIKYDNILHVHKKNNIQDFKNYNIQYFKMITCRTTKV